MTYTGDASSIHDRTSTSRHSRRNVLKRGLALGLTAPAITTLLAACGSDDDDEPAAAATDEPAAAATDEPAASAATSEPTAAADTDEPTAVAEADEEPTADDSGGEATPESDDDEQGAEEPVAGGKLITTQMGDYVHLDPWYTPRPQRPLIHNVFDSLVRYDPDLTVHPRLAESWELSDDGLELSIVLRQGVLFHSGKEFVAEDVVWNVERMRDDSIGHAVYSQTPTLDHAEATDTYTVTLFYAEQTPDLFSALTFAVMISPEAGDDVEANPIGTGPFMFQEWIPQDHSTFVRFDDYWDAPRPYVDEFEVRVGADEQAQVIALQAGEVHLAFPVPTREIARVEDHDETYVSTNNSGSFFHLSLNTQREPFSNKLVRQAIAWCIDRERIVDRVLAGYSRVTNVPLEDTNWGYAEHLEGSYGFDLARAEEMIAEAGYPDGFEFNCITVSAFPEWREIATILQADFDTIGLTMDISEYDSAQGYPLVQSGDFDAHIWTSGRTHKDPSAFFSTQGSFNADDSTQNSFRQGEQFEEYRELILEGAQTVDQDRRIEIYHRLQEIIVDEAFAIPICRRLDVMGLRTEVQGFEWEIDNNWLLENITLS